MIRFTLRNGTVYEGKVTFRNCDEVWLDLKDGGKTIFPAYAVETEELIEE